MTYTDDFLLGLLEFFEWSRWLLLAALMLTLTDLKFGIDAAQYREEPIKKSRAIRRTIDKICSYILWIFLAYTFGKAFVNFKIDLLPLIILMVIYGVELESLFKNYFESKGKSVKIHFLKFFGKKTDLIEVEEKERKKDENK